VLSGSWGHRHRKNAGRGKRHPAKVNGIALYRSSEEPPGVSFPITSPPNAHGLLPLVVERLHRSDFFFINIGANDGINGDPIYPFLRKYGWRGIAVEPLGHMCDELRRNYAQFEGVVVEHAAIASAPRPFYFVAPDATDASFIRQTGSLHSDYIEKTIALMRMYEFQGPVREGLERSIRQVEVPCLTFEQLLAKHAVQRIDFLNIDAEGSDFEILMMIDFTRWRPSILCLETSELGDAQEMHAMEVLRLSGYEYLEPFDFSSQVFVQSEYNVGRARRLLRRLESALRTRGKRGLQALTASLHRPSR